MVGIGGSEMNKEDGLKFEPEKFIKWLEDFRKYFIHKVKLINGVKLQKVGQDYEFYLDIPSTTFRLVLGKYGLNKTTCFIDVYKSPFTVELFEISKQQYDKILSLCKDIQDFVDENEEIFTENRLKTIAKISKNYKNVGGR